MVEPKLFLDYKNLDVVRINSKQQSRAHQSSVLEELNFHIPAVINDYVFVFVCLAWFACAPLMFWATERLCFMFILHVIHDLPSVSYGFCPLLGSCHGN